MDSLNHDRLVSVVLPVFNGESFLGQALDSALCQTHTDLEIVAVDDGSTDRTRHILDEYARQDSRVRVFTQPNSGVARARNLAISKANGVFIAPLDADDIWAPAKLERQVERMIQGGAQTGLVYSWWAWIDADNKLLDRSPRWQIEGDVLRALLQINFVGSASIPLFRRECVAAAGGYNEALVADGPGGCEDWELALRIAAQSRVAVAPEILVGYRRQAGSMSTARYPMWRSQQRVLASIRKLRPDVAPQIFRRAGHQFAMYLVAQAYWSGDMKGAWYWATRAGWRLPLMVLPYVLKLWFKRKKRPELSMHPGKELPTEGMPEALLPYDRIYNF